MRGGSPLRSAVPDMRTVEADRLPRLHPVRLRASCPQGASCAPPTSDICLCGTSGTRAKGTDAYLACFKKETAAPESVSARSRRLLSASKPFPLYRLSAGGWDGPGVSKQFGLRSGSRLAVLRRSEERSAREALYLSRRTMQVSLAVRCVRGVELVVPAGRVGRNDGPRTDPVRFLRLPVPPRAPQDRSVPPLRARSRRGALDSLEPRHHRAPKRTKALGEILILFSRVAGGGC